MCTTASDLTWLLDACLWIPNRILSKQRSDQVLESQNLVTAISLWCDAWLLLRSLHSVRHQFLQHWAARNHNGTGQMGLPCPGWKWTHFSGIQPCQPAFTHSVNHQITRRDLRLINRVLRFHLIDSRLSLYVFFAPKNIKYLKIGHVYGKSSSQVGNIPLTDVGTYKTNIRSRKDNGWLRPFESINAIHSLVKDYLAGVVWKRT